MMKSSIKRLANLALLSIAVPVLAGGSGSGGDSDPILEKQESWAGRASDYQRRLDIYSRLSDSSTLGSHNTYNSEAYRDIDSYLDPQQKHSIYDQLRMGARFIELDAHWTAHTKGWPWQWGDDLLLCHSGIGKELGSLHIGCGLTDRFLSEGLNEIRDWFADIDNADEVIVLYIEDHSDGRHNELYNKINSALGNKIYQSGGCKSVPNTLTKADVLGAGKQIVLWKDGDCASNSSLRNMAFNSLGGMSRIWEDATTVAKISGFFGGAVTPSISASQIREEFKNGRNLVNLDDMTYSDGRLEAAIWSFDNNEPNNSGGNQDCAVQWGNGRWDDATCTNHHPYACRTSSGWVVAGNGPWTDGASACANAGGKFDAPTNSADNESLKAAKNGNSHVWVNFHDRFYEGAWQKGIDGEFQIRSMGKCLDIPGSDSNANAGTNVQLWSCSDQARDQRWTMDNDGRLHNVANPSVCLDVAGSNQNNGANILLWHCHDGKNQRWILDGTSLLSQMNASKSIDVSGVKSANGANIHLYDFHGRENQRWSFIAK
ncbi:Endo-1,4-beta-xylanase A [BD1-7 clade bacterium]|uniref:Endo-1,4-beta-xylanase A n=1 Tax=BD1-7 clade bacterium TaxID=2029982 RepID=A0A5S9NUG5_9GAMM|nr:Endo-1,4-beta-xylanase A [BD1-7 clade bacterium]CAA0109584.1 Endo-1,4-beta-xylanase A [BD1-7 clade bacterium]